MILHLQVSESSSQTFILSGEYQREIMIWRISVNDILTAGGFGEVVWKGQDLRNWDYLRVRGGLGMARSEEQEILDVKEERRKGGAEFLQRQQDLAASGHLPHTWDQTSCEPRYINSSLPLDLNLANSAAPSFLDQVFRIPNSQTDPRVEFG